jgi:hypothetical protein
MPGFLVVPGRLAARGFSIPVFATVTILLSGLVVWNGMQILTIAGLRI